MTLRVLVSWLAARARERSTWLGLTGLLTAAGVALSPDQIATIATVGTAVASAIAALTADPPAAG